MRYAIVINNKVTNIISLLDSNARDFPNAVMLGDRPVTIGDTYDGEKFYRDGEEVLTTVEQLQAGLESLAERVVDLEIQLMEVT